MSAPLNTGTLGLHAGRLAVPAYDRSALAPGVVHISVGSFHRAHQAVFFDDLAARGHEDWGIVGVGLRRSHMREALEPQDGLYTVVERGARGDSARVVGVITQYLFAPEETAAVLDALAAPELRLVTLTVTGAGYGTEPAIELLVAGLARRRAAGLPPFTVLSCDNLPENGKLARASVVGLARRGDSALADWIDAEGAFPSSMVDRITPKTSPEDRAWIAAEFGVDDRWPVVTEPFSQWIVEDDFCAGRPPLEEVGVRFVDDVAPYALMKTRLLNASHCALGHLGALAGHEFAHEAMADPALGAALVALMDEVSPLLPPVPGVDLPVYRASVLERLGNPVLADRLARLRRNGSDKVPTHVLSSLRIARAQGRPHAALTLAVAAWVEALRRFEVEDPREAELRALAGDPRAFVTRSGLFGALADDADWVAELEEVVAELRGLASATLAA